MLYHDGQFDDARLAINLAQTGGEQGAVLLNYCGCVGLRKEGGRVSGGRARDGETGAEFEIRARVVINAPGAFVDELRQFDELGGAPLVTVSQGVHMVLPRHFLPGKAALMVPKTSDGRVRFAIPWHDHFVVGTTDPAGVAASSEPRARADEVAVIMEHARKYLARDPAESDVLSVLAGLRPLVKRGGSGQTAALSRDHTIVISPSKLVTLTGGKWTTYRKMAEDVIDQAEKVGGLTPRPSPTAELRLHGATESAGEATHLRVYGSDAPALAALAKENPHVDAPLVAGLPMRQSAVLWHARQEMARTVEDVLTRRTRALLLDARASIAAAPRVARLPAADLDRDEAWIAAQVAAYTALARGCLLPSAVRPELVAAPQTLAHSQSVISLLKPAPAASPLPADRIDPEYRRLRWQVFAGIFIGYAAFYLVRKNFALAMPDILKEYPHYTKAALGSAMTGLSVAYGVSKFIMGSVSDRSNPRWFMTFGLLLTAGVTFAFGTFPALYGSLTAIIVLQTLNGWFNGMGWPPCGKTMVHWWSTKERGVIVSIWNVSHNVGGGLVAKLAAMGVLLFHDWGAKFYVPAAVAALCAVVIAVLLRDTPQSCGLPPIEQHKKDYPADYSAAHERTFTFKEIFFGYVLNNKFLWAIAVANAFVYFVRYGVVDWIPTYLQTAKGFSFQQSSTAWFAFEFAGIPGTILCGWMSDRVFKGRRAPATILFMALTLIGLVVYGLNRNGPLWIDISALIAIGFFVYGPIMIIGLHALDLVPKKAAGTAAGFTGFFGYVFGSAIAGTGAGWIADHWGWGGVFGTMIVCCVLTMVFSAMTLGHRSASSGS